MTCEYKDVCSCYVQESGLCETFFHLCSINKYYKEKPARIELPEGIKPSREIKLGDLETDKMN